MPLRDKWGQVKEIVASALERSLDERSDFLSEACGQDGELREEVESLLSNAEGADDLLEKSSAANVFFFSSQVMIGRHVGAYRILSETGQGGMAVVYLAERADQEYHKRVAIKMVKPGINHEEIIRRFRNERQTLAGLDHPHIVKLLDGGTSEEGWPYLVMDFVEGTPIDQYCDSHRLPIRERLEIFRTVCQVVHYAHQQRVIHRDLKPSNILIACDGVPRLLDFGIAKLLHPDFSQTSPATTGDWRPMTPEYASPEQLRGEPVTNATDIYSLGVLLYQLLTGHRPYRTTLSSWSEIERVVCKEDPPRPSTVVSRTEEEVSTDVKKHDDTTPESISLARQTSPDELRRCLQGDLDTIVMMALRKEPERRYASAEEFSNDIARHLSSRPVKARQATVVYRTGKFLSRHRESVAAVVIATVLMVGLGLWQARKLRQAITTAPPSSAVHVAVRPSVAILGFKNLSSRPDTAWLSTALSEMLTTELAAGAKLRTVPGETVARSKIDLSLPDADSLASDTLARVRKDLGSDFVVLGSYLDLGRGSGGEIRLDLRLQDTAKGETIATVSETSAENNLLQLVSRLGTRLREQLGVSEISQIETAGILSSVPSNPEALKLYAQGLAKLRTFDALAARDLLTRAVAADPSFPLSHSALAKAWQTLGYDANAAREAKKALELGDKLPREDRLLVEARYYESNWNWDKAIETYRTLFTFFPDNLEYGLGLARAQSYGGKGKDTFSTLVALEQSSTQAREDPRIDLVRAEAASTLSNNQLQRDAGESAATKADKQGAKLLAARARVLECRALANMGVYDQANVVCEEGRKTYAESGDRGGLARLLHAMAEGPLDQDDLVTAERLYRQALSITREVGDKHGIGRELGNLAQIYHARGDFKTERALAEEALRNNRESGDKNGMAAETGNIGILLFHLGKLPGALKYYRSSIEYANQIGNKSVLAVGMSNLGDALAMKGDWTEATKMYQEALILHRELGQKYYYADVLNVFGDLLQQQGENDGARDRYLEALSVEEEIGKKSGGGWTRLSLAELNCDIGKPEQAEPLARTALETFRELKETDGEMMAQSMLSRVLLEQGKLAEARESMAVALTLADKSKDLILNIPVAIAHAYVLSASEDIVASEKIAEQVLAQSRQLGLVRFQLQASLALGEFEMSGKNPGAGRARLEELEGTAHNMGFELIARKAGAARKSLG
jgi:serine/threonine protein kinase/tetratricopeptide (TPR) repeat protein